MPSPSTPATSTPLTRRRKVKYARALGYILDPSQIYREAMKDGTAIEGQCGQTFATYRIRLAKHCGIKYDDVITVHDPRPHMPPVYCVVAATNLSKQSKIPRTDIIEKAKEFLGTEEEPKWYYIARD